MNLGRVWDIVHTISRKESRGNIIKPEQFTYLLQQANWEHFNKQYEKWAGSQSIQDSLEPFVVVDEAVTFSSGSAAIADLSESYIHLIGARTEENLPVLGDLKIQIVSPHVWNEWIGDSVMTGTTDYPIMTKDGTNLKIYPTTLTSVKVSYLREPATPVFDYDVNATSYAVEYDSTGSTELEWGDQDITQIILIILRYIGISMQAPDLAQVSMSLEQQQNVM